MFLVGVSLFPAGAGAAEKLVEKVTWDAAPERAELEKPIAPGDTAPAVVKVVSDSGEKTVTLKIIKKPKITSRHYALMGEVKYKDVHGTGYLEMWNSFPNGGAFFSRTLGNGGPMGSISGSSEWRKFLLPFNSTENQFPDELTFNVVLGGKGTVWVREVKLVEYPQSATARATGAATQAGTRSGWGSGGAEDAWWGPRTGGWIGSIAGVLLGLWGAVVGALVPLGRGRRLISASAWMLGAFGFVVVTAGLVAVSHRQPYEVCYPLVLIGFITAILGTMATVVIKRRFEQNELRKMNALDAA
jgi:hypothetical protein